jgi:hypothetical protein
MMNRMKFLLGTILLFSVSLAPAQESLQSQQEEPSAEKVFPKATVSPFATNACSFTFTTGSGETFLKYCVTANGNITEFEAPQGFEHIRHGAIGEGYGLCDQSTNAEYFDYADFGDSPNWGAPTVVSQSATSVKITRTTADGIWTLTQTITQVAGTPPSARVAMSIRNNSSVDRTIFVVRWTDAEPDHLFSSSMGATSNSAFAWDQSTALNLGFRSNFGIMLQGVGIPQQSLDAGPEGFLQHDTSGFDAPPPPCDPHQFFLPGVQTDFVGGLTMLYQLGVPHKSSKAITVNYKGI